MASGVCYVWRAFKKKCSVACWTEVFHIVTDDKKRFKNNLKLSDSFVDICMSSPQVFMCHFRLLPSLYFYVLR